MKNSNLSYRLSVIGYRLSVIGYRLSVIGYRLSVIGYRLSVVILVVFASCSSDENFKTVQNHSNQTTTSQSLNSLVSVENGILRFRSQADFDLLINSLKRRLKRGHAKNFYSTLYSNNFSPLFPKYGPNDPRWADFKRKKMQRHQPREMWEPDDDLIINDLFASLLTFQREIIVGDELYKYTYHGLFHANVKDSLQLYAYLNRHAIDGSNPPDPTTLPPGENQVSNNPPIFQYTNPSVSGSNPCVQHSISYSYVDPGHTNANEENMGPCNDGIASDPYTQYDQMQDHENAIASLNNFSRNLSPCNTTSTGIFGWNPFGSGKKCFAYFNSNSQVKTKFYNVNYEIYSEVGVKAKYREQDHDVFWITEQTDYVGVVINELFFSREIPNSSAPLFDPPSPTEQISERKFWIENTLYETTPSGQINYSDTGPVHNQNLIPDTPFNEDVIVEIFANNQIVNPFTGNGLIQIDEQNVKNIFYQIIYDQVKSLIPASDPSGQIAMIFNTPQKQYFYYCNLTAVQADTKKLVKTIENSWYGKISLSIPFGPNGIATDWHSFSDLVKNIGFEPNPAYNIIDVEITGAAKRYGTWKGSKIKFGN